MVHHGNHNRLYSSSECIKRHLTRHLNSENQHNRHINTMAVYLAEPAADLLAVTFTAILFTVRFKKALQTMENKKIQET